MLPGILIVLALLLIYLGGCWWTYRFAFYSPKGKQNDDHTVPVSVESEPHLDDIHRMIDQLNAVPYEEVFVTSGDGLRLRGRYYHQNDDAPLAICFHGYRGTPTRDFSGGSRILARLGYNMLLVEERAHCGSEGHTISFGVNERKDCLAWIYHFHYRFPKTEIVLYGVSMGAATVLMAAGLPMPDAVKGIVADCPFTEPLAIIKKVGRDVRVPAWVTTLVAPGSALIFGRFRLSSASALKAVREAKVPIMLIHGEADSFVPCDMSRALHEANPEGTELHTFPNANHGISYLADPKRYAELVRDFSRRVLKDEGGCLRA